MSSEAGKSLSGPWQSNGTYPASDASGPLSGDSDSPSSRPAHLPTVEERIGEIVREYPDRVLRPVSAEHGRKLREEVLEEAETVRREVETGEDETMVVEDEVSRSARPWIDVIARFLEDYEGYRDKYLRMARGEDGEPDREEFLIKMHNSFAPEYQRKQYARLKAMKRQFIGEEAGESPTGEHYDGAFSDPVTVLFGLTASSTTATDRYRPVIDHDRAIRDAWGGSDGVRRTLRYLLQDKMGLESSEYAWWWQSEPHPGGGAASGYSHSHPVVILDAAAVEVDGPDPSDPETYRPIVAKHVAECEGAEWAAHRITDGRKSAVKVREDGEINDFAGYVSEYLSVDPDEDLMERSAEYVMWAASQWASTTQKYSKSRTATAAIDADRCHQEFIDEDARQSHDHGVRVVMSDRPGVEYECAECGSEFGVDQTPETLVDARRSSGSRAVADGGCVPARVTPGDVEVVLVSKPREVDVRPSVFDEMPSGASLAERWPSARRGASVGSETVVRECGHSSPNTCPLCAEDVSEVPNDAPIPEDATADVAESSVESFERAPTWRPEAVVSKASGEESQIGTPGGVSYGEVVVEGADAIPPEKLINPDKLRGPDPEVDPAEYPPPELIERQLYEIHSGERITAKRWEVDWHEERWSDRPAAASSTSEESVDWERVMAYREENPGATIEEIVRECEVPVSEKSVVGSVVGGPHSVRR